MDIYLLNEIQKLEAGGGSSAAVSGDMFLPRNEDGSLDKSVIPIVSRSGQRQAAYPSSWTTSYGGTTFYTYNSDAHSMRMRFWQPSGNARKDTNDLSGFEGTAPEIIYASNNKVGVCKSHTSHWTGSSYAPWRTSIMFIKNKGTSNKTVTIYGSVSSQYSSGHDGSSMTYYNPNNSNPALVTGISDANFWGYSSTSTSYNNSGSITIDAGKTIAVTISNSMYYHQDTNSNASWHDLNGFYSLQTTFSDPDIIPDLEMTQTYLMMRHYVSSYTTDPVSVWQAKAIFFPEL